MDFKFISKSIELIEKENFSNGRMIIYSTAWKEIRQKPFLGNGIGKFMNDYDIFQHNLILQLLHEGGVVLLIFIGLPLAYGIYVMIFKNEVNIDTRYMLVLLCSSSVVKLMISSEFWKEQSFWMFISISIITMIRQRKTNKLK